MSFCNDCPLRPTGGMELEPPERSDRLKMLAASNVPVQCHKAVQDEAHVAASLAGSGKDWRLDHPVTTPCFGTVKA